MTIEYVAGFMFDETMARVLLIEKAKPEWQKGKLNGIGGKIERKPAPWQMYDESPQEAMAREFEEEAGVKTKPEDWRLFRSEQFSNGTGAIVHFLWSRGNHAFWNATAMTEERLVRVGLHQIKHCRDAMMYNLPYLIEMATCYAQQPIENVPAP